MGLDGTLARVASECKDRMHVPTWWLLAEARGWGMSEFVAVLLDERKAVREATGRSGGGLNAQTPLLGRVRLMPTSKNDLSHAAQ